MICSNYGTTAVLSNAYFMHKMLSQLVLQINVGSTPIYSVKIVRAATCSYAKFNDVTNRVMRSKAQIQV